MVRLLRRIIRKAEERSLRESVNRPMAFIDAVPDLALMSAR